MEEVWSKFGGGLEVMEELFSALFNHSNHVRHRDTPHRHARWLAGAMYAACSVAAYATRNPTVLPRGGERLNDSR